jgi:large subunit ribosomal protein L10
MSKYVKDLLTKDLQQRFQGVNDALLVSVAGLGAIKNYELRKQLRSQDIHLLVVKNSMVRRATEGTPLAAAFHQAEGSLAVVWGSTDIVSLAKTITKFAEDKNFAPLQTRGGVMDGARLTAAQVKEVSSWPSREEQLSLLVGQILGPGAKLAAQLLGPGGALASQIKQKSEGSEGEEKTGDAADPAAEPAAG